MATFKLLAAMLTGAAAATGVPGFEDGNIIAATGGAGQAGKLVLTNAQGQLDPSFFGSGFGQPTFTGTVATGSTLTAGDEVYDDPTAGTGGVKQAIATAVASRSRGFVRSAGAAGSVAVIYTGGINDAQASTGAVKGDAMMLSRTTAGKAVTASSQSLASYATGNVIQYLGDAISPTSYQSLHNMWTPVNS